MRKWLPWAMLGYVISVLGVLWFLTPAPLHFDLLSAQTEQSFHVGLYTVRFVLKPLQAGDNGDVQIEVFQGAKRIKTLVSQFSFDTLVDKPPALRRWAWLDGDVFPDLLLESDANTFFVGSRDGLVHL
jgi:hypothetical protein